MEHECAVGLLGEMGRLEGVAELLGRLWAVAAACGLGINLAAPLSVLFLVHPGSHSRGTARPRRWALRMEERGYS